MVQSTTMNFAYDIELLLLLRLVMHREEKKRSDQRG
jgi:hypothetical protein